MAPQPRRDRDRDARVAAGAEHHVGALRQDHDERLDRADHVDQRRPRPQPPAAARESAAQDDAHADPGLGNRDCFETATPADEHYVRAGSQPAQLLGDRDAGEYVSAGAAACDQHLHAASRFQLCLASASPAPFTTLIRYSKPAAARFASSAEPPYETNGSGRPVVGARPVATARLTNAYSASCSVRPAASRNWNESVARAMTRNPRHTKMTNNTMRRVEPRNPSSSARMEKMKS